MLEPRILQYVPDIEELCRRYIVWSQNISQVSNALFAGSLAFLFYLIVSFGVGRFAVADAIELGFAVGLVRYTTTSH